MAQADHYNYLPLCESIFRYDTSVTREDKRSSQAPRAIDAEEVEKYFAGATATQTPEVRCTGNGITPRADEILLIAPILVFKTFTR